MAHSGHGHGDMDMDMCSMNMLFTWDTTNLCIVFRSWRITGTWSLLWSLLAVMALTAGYEAVREACRRYEARQAAQLEHLPNGTQERDSLLHSGNVVAGGGRRGGDVVKAAFYGVQVFYSFFIMLLFMTYNGWIMLAVGFGAFFGYLIFGGASATKSAACH
ncbi:Ctr copper transporter [Neohortaea acidophila]|uniref:Copper transport protein n=1 Tax=Neohortaea acidophila TaxID=245834 RepID=A0A6A6PRZ8_9PEZI|nr:Ctr copper transporter [Neohortaea acidophila]KAF2482556.1 Ctr copper transporter [Neohortaea acidophila]